MGVNLFLTQRQPAQREEGVGDEVKVMGSSQGKCKLRRRVVRSGVGRWGWGGGCGGMIETY